MVVTHQQLVGEDRREYLGLVVAEATMPYALIQLEQRFEPLVEWFYRFLALRIDAPAFSAFQKLAPVLAVSGTPKLGHLEAPSK